MSLATLTTATTLSFDNLPTTTFRVAFGNLPTADELTWTTGATSDYTLSNANKRINFTAAGVYLILFNINADITLSNTFFTSTVSSGAAIIGSIGLQTIASGANASNGSCQAVISATAGQQLYVRSDREYGTGNCNLFDQYRLGLTIVKLG